MALSPAQHDLVESYFDEPHKTDWKANFFGAIWAYGTLGVIAWHEFGNGPEFLANIGLFAFIVLLLLVMLAAIVMFIMDANFSNTTFRTEEQYKRAAKFYYGRIRGGKTYKGAFAKSSIFWIPSLLITIGLGWFWIGALTVIAFLLAQLVAYGVLDASYKFLDKEMADSGAINDPDAIEGEILLSNPLED